MSSSRVDASNVGEPDTVTLLPEDRFDPILEQHFRYEGPRPQSRESGIIMLADTVEAAARTLAVKRARFMALLPYVGD